jgi:hypothetical protein
MKAIFPFAEDSKPEIDFGRSRQAHLGEFHPSELFTAQWFLTVVFDNKTCTHASKSLSTLIRIV